MMIIRTVYRVFFNRVITSVWSESRLFTYQTSTGKKFENFGFRMSKWTSKLLLQVMRCLYTDNIATPLSLTISSSELVQSQLPLLLSYVMVRSWNESPFQGFRPTLQSDWTVKRNLQNPDFYPESNCRASIFDVSSQYHCFFCTRWNLETAHWWACKKV